jgi:hypothetical protein
MIMPMTSAELKDALNRDPFHAFRLRFGSGKVIQITNPGLVAVSSTGRTAFAFKSDGEGFDVFDILLVEAMEFEDEGNNGNGRNRKGKKR